MAFRFKSICQWLTATKSSWEVAWDFCFYSNLIWLNYTDCFNLLSLYMLGDGGGLRLACPTGQGDNWARSCVTWRVHFILLAYRRTYAQYWQAEGLSWWSSTKMWTSFYSQVPNSHSAVLIMEDPVSKLKSSDDPSRWPNFSGRVHTKNH